jgi:hypothetical protein
MGNVIVSHLRNVMNSDNLSIRCIRALSITIYSRISTTGSRESGILFYSYLNESTGFLSAAFPILKIIVNRVAENIIEAASKSIPGFI